MSCHILIADDDTFTRTVLESVLTSRGHSVTVADDGLRAVKLLSSERFDLAVLDYHMPRLDGIAAARRVRELAHGHQRGPRFIAVTADPDGLEARDQGRGVFDAIVQKPINIESLIEVIEDTIRQVQEALANEKILGIWRAHGLDRAPRGRFAVKPHEATRLRLDRIFDLAKPQNPDCILMTSETDASAVAELRTLGNLYTLPVIDLTGRFPHSADAVFRLHDLASWDEVAMRVREFASHRRQLTKRFLGTSDPGDQLLAYVFVSGRDLRPVVDLDDKHGVSYRGLFPTARLLPVAERLVAAGLLRRLRPPAAVSDGPAGVLMSAPHFTLTDAAIEELIGTTDLDQLDAPLPIAS